MTISVDGGISTEALDYKFVHMNSMEINQTRKAVEAGDPTFQVIISYRLFAVDSNGVKHFDKVAHQIKIDDYLTLAKQKAAYSDFDLISAFASIEVAVASIIGDAGSVGAATVTQ